MKTSTFRLLTSAFAQKFLMLCKMRERAAISNIKDILQFVGRFRIWLQKSPRTMIEATIPSKPMSSQWAWSCSPCTLVNLHLDRLTQEKTSCIGWFMNKSISNFGTYGKSSTPAKPTSCSTQSLRTCFMHWCVMIQRIVFQYQSCTIILFWFDSNIN